jgi:hypothetical protein
MAMKSSTLRLLFTVRSVAQDALEKYLEDNKMLFKSILKIQDER